MRVAQYLLEVRRVLFRSILSSADGIVVATAIEGGVGARDAEPLVRYLGYNGISARTVSLDPSGGLGESVLAAAKAERADLVVMGAYTHSRVRQLVFGGLTRYVLGHADLPVLMAH